MVSDGGVEIDGIVVAEESTATDGSPELGDFSPGISAEVVVLADNVSVSKCWGIVSKV